MDYVDVLGSSGRSVGKMKSKSEVHRDGDWHGAAHLWILNREGQILIQRRSPTKENWPNLWDVSVAGHISAREGPVEAALRDFEKHKKSLESRLFLVNAPISLPLPSTYHSITGTTSTMNISTSFLLKKTWTLERETLRFATEKSLK
jgi:hypothetical protein